MQVGAGLERFMYDVTIYNGKVMDGSGSPPFYADLALKDGKIIKTGKINPKEGKRSIDAKGLVLTPGFIDLHAHSDIPILVDGNAESKVRHRNSSPLGTLQAHVRRN